MGFRDRLRRIVYDEPAAAPGGPSVAVPRSADSAGSSSFFVSNDGKVGAALADVAEQVNPQAFSQSIIDEDRGWRSLISGGMRELTWAQIIENLNNATDYYRTNPLAFRLVQLQVDHVLGDGMQLKAADPKVQAEIDLWWHHPLNDLGLRQFTLMTALSLDGEIFVTVHTNPYDLTSYVRLVPAALIDRIETNPDDLEDELKYHQTAQPMTPDTLMRMPSALQAEGRWWDKGDMFHFAVNRPAGVVRGMSDLAPILPWLRRYRDWLTDRVRLNKYRTAFVWHVQIKGADRRAVTQRMAELAVPPPPGSVIVSNENETWTAVLPQIQAPQVADDGLAIRLMIAAGAGVPLYFLAEAERTARGTASEMSAPTYLHYRERQLFFGSVMRTLAVEALHRRGLVDVGIDDITAEFPELDPDASLQVAQGIENLTDSLAIAVDRQWVTNEEASRVFQHFLGEVASLPGADPGAGPSSGAAGPTTSWRNARARRRAGPLRGPDPLDERDPRFAEPKPPPYPGRGTVVPDPTVRV
jgi:hypothetical protein